LWALVAVTLTGAVAEYLVAPQHRLWVANGTWTVGCVAAVLGTFGALRRCGPEVRRGWARVVAGCAVFLVGQLVWDLYSATSFPASPNVGDLIWFAAALITASGVKRLAREARHSRAFSWLELGPLVISVSALLVTLLWHELQDSDLTAGGKATAMVYAAVYASAALIILQTTVVGGVEMRRNTGMVMLVVGLGIEAAAFVLWAPQLLEGSYVVGSSVVDGMWTAGFLLIGVGAWVAKPVVAMPDADAVSRRRGGILPSGTFLVLAGCQLVLIATGDGADPPHEQLVLSAGILVVGCALISRASILLRRQTGLYAELGARGLALDAVNDRLGVESRRDELTGLANRLRLREDFSELTEAVDEGRSFCLVLLDLDHFKEFNDSLGHQAGDRALLSVASLLDAGIRDDDRAYRYGGEEILIVLRDVDLDRAHNLAERHRSKLEAAAIAHPANRPLGVLTMSVGIAAHRPGEAPRDVLRRADRALYRAKAQGRNRCVRSEPAGGTSAAASQTV
jgi:diguanylate cyclase (GGDEF)-like protein